MTIFQERNVEFWKQMSLKSREELLELIGIQNPDLITQIERVEWVFRNKLRHLNWPNGEQITERPFTNEELALLIDPLFEPFEELLDLDIPATQQRELHVASDAVMWSREVLNVKPRVYQILMLRHPNPFKVLRAGRRLGKTFTMALKLMHYSYVNKNGKSIVIAPMLAQASLIYKEVIKIAKESPLMMEAIDRKKASPPAEINLTNGSSIIFFTSGMKTGSKADATRGQEAHLIILDELDYMGDDDLDAILAMMQKTDENQPEKELIGASTPTGRRAVFYDWCTDPKMGFQEFWFPSYANPHFRKKDEDRLRNQYTDLGWRHEIEADWGEDAQGVYPKKYVDMAFSAKEPWDYDLHPGIEGPDPDSFFVMGVDWDKYGAGTNIVVLQVFGRKPRDPQLANRAIMYYREEVPRDEYTFTKATNRIIELNEVLNPRHIYIDRGSGEVQAEMLHLYGKEHPRSMLHKKVKGIQFGENIDVREPYTQEMTKKPIKPYMVDNLRLFLERKQILFPEHDDELHLQLLSYIVIRENESGRPVFEMSSGKIGDHAHDALILACYAITDNYGDLHNLKINFRGVPLTPNLVPDSKNTDTIAEDKEEDREKSIFSISRSLTSGRKRRATNRISRSMF